MIQPLAKINHACSKLLATLTPSQTAVVVCQEAAYLSSADLVSLNLYHNGHFHLSATHPKTASFSPPRPRGFSYAAYKNQKSFVLRSSAFRETHTTLFMKGFRTALYIPLFDEHKSLGTINLFSKNPSGLSSSTEKLLRTFGIFCTLAIKNSRLLKQNQDSLLARDQFISFAGHELRTPLTSISGYAQLLKSKLPDAPQNAWISELLHETQRLIRLVNELLEVNRLRAGSLHYHLEPCRLKTNILLPTLKLFKTTHPNCPLDLQDHLAKNQDNLIADCTKISQVLIALLQLAARSVLSSTPITIKLANQKSHLLLSISYKSDQKIHTLPNLFEGFTEEGVGVSLLLSRYIVSYHHGTISVAQSEDKTVTLEVKFPRVKT